MTYFPATRAGAGAVDTAPDYGRVVENPDLTQHAVKHGTYGISEYSISAAYHRLRSQQYLPILPHGRQTYEIFRKHFRRRTLNDSPCCFPLQ